MRHLDTCPIDFQQYFFSSLPTSAKSTTSNSIIKCFIPYSFENVWNWQRQACYDATESTKIVVGRGSTPHPTGGASNATLNSLGSRGESIPSASQCLHLSCCPHCTKSWLRHWTQCVRFVWACSAPVGLSLCRLNEWSQLITSKYRWHWWHSINQSINLFVTTKHTQVQNDNIIVWCTGYPCIENK